MRLPAALSHSRVAARWAALLALSAALGGLFAWMRVPAAFLLGPMLAGILASWARHGLEVSRPCFAAAQGVVGCLIGGSIAASFSGSAIGRSWPAFAGGVLAVVVAAWLVGWGMLRLRVLPGTTIAWGLSPGAAPAMVILAESNGADAQLVAFMQYLRVLLVTAVASVMVRVLGVAPAHPVEVLPAVDVAWGPLLLTLAVAVPGALTAELLRAPAGAFLFPLVASVPLASVGLLSPLPRWILVAAYAFIGWQVGLRFTRPLLAHAARAFSRTLLGMVILIAACGGVAAVMVLVAGVDPLTAYLATSPGGVDTVAIIAATSTVDRPFVMAMQAARFTVVLVAGPAVARYLAARTGSERGPSTAS